MRRQYPVHSIYAIIPSYRIVPALFVTLIAFAAMLLKFAPSAEAETIIPSDAIRIRILANSNSAFDQQVKRHVQAEVSSLIVSWGPMPESRNEARAFILSRLPDVRKTVEEALRHFGVTYGSKAVLGKVSFPEKIFGGRTYAAGDYEALRITLGEGVGANWWCVLFPPLCLTAATAESEPKGGAEKQGVKSGLSRTGKPGTSNNAEEAAHNDDKSAGKNADAASDKAGKAASKKAGSGTVVSAKAKTAVAAASVADNGEDAQAGAEKPEPKFFLWELLRKLFAFLGSLFS